MKRKFIQGVSLHKPMARVFKRSKSLELHNLLYHAQAFTPNLPKLNDI